MYVREFYEVLVVDREYDREDDEQEHLCHNLHAKSGLTRVHASQAFQLAAYFLGWVLGTLPASFRLTAFSLLSLLRRYLGDLEWRYGRPLYGVAGVVGLLIDYFHGLVDGSSYCLDGHI